MKLRDQLIDYIKDPLELEGFEIIELKLSRYKSSHRVQVYVDSDNGVSLDDCSRLSAVIGSIIEENGVISSRYILEVSSPGLDRPLMTSRDFSRRIGERIEVYFDDVESAPVQGELISAGESSIELKLDDGKKKIDLVKVKKGKIIF
jgi:ribosome maturation factor RimP